MREAFAEARKCSKPVQLRRFGASLEHPLQPQADAQQWSASCDANSQDLTERVIAQRGSCLEMAHSRDNPFVCLFNTMGIACKSTLSAEILERLHY